MVVQVDFTKAGLKNPTLIRLDVENKLSENLQFAFLADYLEQSVLREMILMMMPMTTTMTMMSKTNYSVSVY